MYATVRQGLSAVLECPGGMRSGTGRRVGQVRQAGRQNAMSGEGRVLRGYLTDPGETSTG